MKFPVPRGRLAAELVLTDVAKVVVRDEPDTESHTIEVYVADPPTAESPMYRMTAPYGEAVFPIRGRLGETS